MLSLLLISIRACFKLFLIELLLLQSVAVAYADTIVPIDYLVPDGSTNTYTDRATNGTPIVNIAAPSGAGVSLNNWEQYNVTNQNQILNNYRGTTVDTNLAGAIYGNPNFAPVGVREARVIVNQVTSSTVSNLNGYVEIAGGKADLVIANPNGINVAGAGFINTGRLSLVSGVAHLDEVGALNNFTLGTGTGASIIITGINTPAYANLGLDIGSVDYSDIISRSVLVLGDIHAKVLEIKTGNKTYDYNSKLIDSEVISGALPSFALDSSYLGGIYAGKITLVATEAGIG
jgi:filamentous hemagglutinin